MKMEQTIDPLFTAEEIIEGGFIPNEATLVSLVLDKKLVIYDHSGKNLVDIDSKKQIFSDIQKLCEPVTEENVVLQKASTNPYTKQFTPERRGSKTYYRVKSYPREGGWILPWSALKKILSEDKPKVQWPIITIPESQYLAIKAGWNADRDSEVIHDSFFKKSELDTLQPKEQNESTKEKGYQTVDPKTERTDLLIIGGLLGLLKEPEGKFTSEAQIISALNDWQPNTPGYSKRNLEDRFKLAKKAINQME